MIPKFRGFRTKTEEWVDGNLIYREEPYQHDIVTPIGNCSTISYAVERDSIGQWTGLKDKNGKDIFEGDIVRVTDGEERTDFSDGGIGTICGLDELYMWYIDGQVHNGLFDINGQYYIEVIGNVHENPELLEVEG